MTIRTTTTTKNKQTNKQTNKLPRDYRGVCVSDCFFLFPILHSSLTNCWPVLDNGFTSPAEIYGTVTHTFSFLDSG